MDNDANRALRRAVLRLAARARDGRNPDWLRHLRRMSCENLSVQLSLLLRATGYRTIVRLYNSFVHSREVQRVIEDDVFERQLSSLYVFRGIANVREERLGKSKFFQNNFHFIYIFFIYSFRESHT